MSGTSSLDESVRRSLPSHIEGLRDVGHLFYHWAWSLGTSSNYSVVLSHEPLRLLLTASGKDKRRLGPSDFVVVDEDGQAVEPASLKPSAETMLHVVLAKQPNVRAVLHTHSIWGTVLSDLHAPAGGLHIEGYEMLKGLAGVTTHDHRQWVEVFDNSQDIPALANRVRQRLNDATNPLRHGFLIRGHGLYTWGRDLDEARRHVEIFEFLFEVVGRRTAIERNVLAVS
jgi:methylthioribulose-1-phosphate dehydratase